MPRVCVLTSDDHHHKALVSILAAEFAVVGAIIEPAREQLRLLRRQGRWADYLWNQYHRIRRVTCGYDRYRRMFFQARTRRGDAPRFVPTHTVGWINDPRVPDWVRAWHPDVTIVCCTTILKAPLLAACGPTVLNIHGGYVPDYRGNHCVWQALDDGRFDRLGATIHFVDRGIDTGDIVARVRPTIRPDDNAETLYCRAEEMAFRKLTGLLRKYDRGEPLPRMPQPPGGTTYRTRDRKPWHDLSHWIRRTTGQLRVPYLPATEGEGRDPSDTPL